MRLKISFEKISGKKIPVQIKVFGSSHTCALELITIYLYTKVWNFNDAIYFKYYKL